MNRTSIFTVYSGLCLAGVAGVAVLAFAGKISEPMTVAAFFAFYGFLCTTGIFWMLGKVKAQMEWYDDRHHSTVDENAQRIADVYRNVENEVRQINSRMDDIDRDVTRETGAIWSALESVPVKK